MAGQGHRFGMTGKTTRPILVVQEDSGLRAALLDVISRVQGIHVSPMDPELSNDTTFTEIEVFRPGLLFLDSFLPGEESALDLLKDIIDSKLSAKVVLVTTLTEDPNADRAKKMGAWDVLVLPHETGRAESLTRLWLKLGGGEPLDKKHEPDKEHSS